MIRFRSLIMLLTVSTTDLKLIAMVGTKDRERINLTDFISFNEDFPTKLPR